MMKTIFVPPPLSDFWVRHCLQSVQYEDDDNETELSCLDEMFLSSLDDELDNISMHKLDSTRIFKYDR